MFGEGGKPISRGDDCEISPNLQILCTLTYAKFQRHFGDVIKRIEAIEFVEEKSKGLPLEEERPIFKEINQVLQELRENTFI